MKGLHMVTFTLLAIGGLNWLLIGINADWNLVVKIFGSMPNIVRVIYLLVGLSAVFEIFTHKANCKCCVAKVPGQM